MDLDLLHCHSDMQQVYTEQNLYTIQPFNLPSFPGSPSLPFSPWGPVMKTEED